ncbi:MAG TPA: FAD-dependent oxidoreductase [Capillimicrobium sp.]
MVTPPTHDTSLAPGRLAALRAVCDTLLPALETADGGPVGDFFARGASARGIPDAIAAGLGALPPHQRRPLEELLADLDASGFAEADLEARTAALRAAGDRLPGGRFAVKQLKTAVFGQLFGAFDAQGRNPAWDAVGFPGPVSAPPTPEQAPKTLPLVTVSGPEATLTADVCIVGSGAGGSVIAARLAQAGRDVLVLEAGPYRNEADFRQLEAEGAEMYLGGGLRWSEDGSMGLLAGSALGGGTVINSMVCRLTPDDVRRQWAELGLDGLDGPEWDGYVETVWQELNANVEATQLNRNAEVLVDGLTALGLTHQKMARNASLDDDPRFCGYCNAGCQQGCKRSTLKNYLPTAAEAGARFLVGCRVERVTTADGRATGVEATVGETRLRVEAPTVVVAAGALETPAVLLRSGIGGEQVGRNLCLHPTYMVTGVYDEPVEAWSGQLITVVSVDFMEAEEGGGFFIAPLGLSPATWAGQSPFSDGRAAREHLLKLAHMASWHAISHDIGAGRVVLDEAGEALVRWSLADPLDRRVAVRGQAELARVHKAAGAKEIFTFHWTDAGRWREGEDFEAYLAGFAELPVADTTAYSAHQMGSCRMGASPETSVADTRGELHDTTGVWIGDASALPGPPGVNPMITIMAMAERTAARMLEAA